MFPGRFFKEPSINRQRKYVVAHNPFLGLNGITSRTSSNSVSSPISPILKIINESNGGDSNSDKEEKVKPILKKNLCNDELFGYGNLNEKICSNYSKHLASDPENQQILKLQIKHMHDEIKKDLETLHPFRGRAIPKHVVELIFIICQNLKVGHEVRFGAIEIYDRFMIRYNEEFKKKLRDQKIGENIKKLIADEIKGNCLIRVATAVLVSAKLYSDITHPFIYCGTIIRVLEELNSCHHLEEVTSWEHQIFKLLDYKLRYINCFDVIEGVLVSLSIDPDNFRVAYDLAGDFLEYISQEHDDVYDKFFAISKAKYDKIDRETFRTIEFDKRIEAAAIVASVLFVVFPKDDKKFTPAIAELSGANEEDFLELSGLLIKLIVR